MILKLIVNLVLPALGLVLAALAQLGLTTLWPAIQGFPSYLVSIDSYLAVLLTLGLCFFAGRRPHTNVPTVLGAACVGVVPLVWLGLTLRGILAPAGHIVWFRSLTVFMMVIAVVPLIGVGLGWVSSPAKRRSSVCQPGR
jgi:O-antigen ligase